MLEELIGRIRDEDEVGVPRRFSIGTIFVLLTLYAMLFRLLVLLGTEANWTGVICLFFAAVTVGQMVLFRGAKPRAASVIVGAVACPAMLILIALDEFTTKWTGMTPVAASLNRMGMFASTLVLLTLLGLGFGYFVGGMMASVFYVIGKMRPATGIAGFESQGAPPTDDLPFARWASMVGTWIIPYQPKTPLRGAFAILWTILALGFLIAPFVLSLATHHVMLVALGVGICSAIWSGNFQLWFYWPFGLTAIGIFVAIWPADALKEAAFQQMFLTSAGASPAFVNLLMTLGGFVGLTVSAVAGWLQWYLYRNEAKRGLGVVTLAGFALLMVGIGWLAANRATAWVQSPSQRLLKKVIADGGQPYWAPINWTPRGVWLTEASNDDELLMLLSMMHDAYAIDFSGAGFTDVSVAALEGMHLQSFGAHWASITNAAFDNVTDFSSSQLGLTDCRFGDDGLATLLTLPQVPKVLEWLNLDGTDITGEAFLSLKGCKSLTMLSIGRCQHLTDAGLANLSTVPALTCVVLSGSPITDDGLAILVKSVPGLQQLHLDSCTEITDEGLAHLSKCVSLRSLRCKGTSVTSAGVAAFRSTRPACGIVWDDPSDE